MRPLPPIMMSWRAPGSRPASPGESAEARLSLFAEENAAPGYYALPCLVTYKDDLEEGKRREQKAAVIYVGQRDQFRLDISGRRSWPGIRLLSAWLVLEKIRPKQEAL